MQISERNCVAEQQPTSSLHTRLLHRLFYYRQSFRESINRGKTGKKEVKN